MYFQWFCLSDPIIFRLIFRWFFMFCSEPLLESIFGAQNADLYSKSRFLEPSRISKGPKNDPRGDTFEPKGLQRASSLYRGLRLGADPAPHDPPNRPQDTISSIWDWFWSDFGSIFDGFGLHLGWSFGDLSKIACNLFRICLKWCWSHFVIDVSSLLPTSHMTNHPTNHEH